MEDESKFIDRARAGDKDAFLALYDVYFTKIFKFVYYKVGHQEEAEDITQETFLKALQGIHNFHGDSKFLSWLMQIAKFTIMDYFREKYKYPKVELQEYMVCHTDDLDFDSEDEDDASDRHTSQIHAILDTLPENYRKVLQCRFLENMNLQETAEAMKTTVGNVKILQFRALKKAAQMSDLL